MTSAADWFETEREFRQLCGDAVSLAHGEASEEFAAEMVKKANEHGLFTWLSQKQLNWLCQIADWQVPNRRKP
jgi:hypothetical protein